VEIYPDLPRAGRHCSPVPLFARDCAVLPARLEKVSLAVDRGAMTERLPIRTLAGPNAIAPTLLSPAERRTELCRLLALGLVRLRARQSSGLSDLAENSSLDFTAERSGHATAEKLRKP
jgi:hypothetical protein